MSSPPRFGFDDPSEGAPEKQPEKQLEKQPKSDKCAAQSKSFQDCLKFSGKDNSHCQFLKDKLTECRKTLTKRLPLVPLPSLEDSEDDMYVLTGDPCFAQSQTFENCLKTSGDDSSQCDLLKDKLTECRKAASLNYNYVSRSVGIDDDEYWH